MANVVVHPVVIDHRDSPQATLMRSALRENRGPTRPPGYDDRNHVTISSGLPLDAVEDGFSDWSYTLNNVIIGSSATPDPHLSTILHLLPLLLPTLTSIRLNISSEVILQRVMAALKSAPKLQYLSLNSVRLDDSVMKTSVALSTEEAPLLRVLRLQGCAIPWTSSVFARLTTLSITLPAQKAQIHDDYVALRESTREFTFPTLLELIAILDNHSQLAHLTLSYALPVLTPVEWHLAVAAHTIRLPNLKALRLAGRPCDCISLYSCLDIPSTAALYISVACCADETRNECTPQVSDVFNLAAAHASRDSRELSSSPDWVASINMWGDELVMSVSRILCLYTSAQVTVHHDMMPEEPPVDVAAEFLMTVAEVIPLTSVTIVDHKHRHLSPLDFAAILGDHGESISTVEIHLCSVPAFAEFFATPSFRTGVPECHLPHLVSLIINGTACAKQECAFLWFRFDTYLASPMKAWGDANPLKEVVVVGYDKAMEKYPDLVESIEAQLYMWDIALTYDLD